MVEMCDLIPCRNFFLHMAPSSEAIQHMWPLMAGDYEEEIRAIMCLS